MAKVVFDLQIDFLSFLGEMNGGGAGVSGVIGNRQVL